MGENILIVTLGCPKNTVDSENMAYLLQQQGHTILDDPQDADVIIINTCGFIHDAKEESVEAIMQAVALKEVKQKLRIIVTGCLAQRYAKELAEEIPEADVFVGTGNFYEIAEMIGQSDRINLGDIDSEIVETGRILTTPPHYAYIKLAEGCDKHCTYCIIPKIRGRQRSRKMEDIVREARRLAKEGVRELILIAQDTGEYGTDLYGERKLAELLILLDQIEELRWIRLLYVYPETIDDKLIAVMANAKRILPYIDIPFQHISDAVLRKMGRMTDSLSIHQLIATLRESIPEIVIRSTFIVGFPQETKDDVQELADFLRESRLDRVGVFRYSKEEGTPAAGMDGQIPEEEKQRRYDELMSIQEVVSDSVLEKYLDIELDAVVEEEIEPGIYCGRTRIDAPEIDGVVYIYSDEALQVGKFYPITIEDSMEYDLIGRYSIQN